MCFSFFELSALHSMGTPHHQPVPRFHIILSSIAWLRPHLLPVLLVSLTYRGSKPCARLSSNKKLSIMMFPDASADA